jgi:hypothetical protein
LQRFIWNIDVWQIVAAPFNGATTVHQMATCHLTFGKEYFILKADCDDFVAASTILKIELGPQNPKSHPQTCQ